MERSGRATSSICCFIERDLWMWWETLSLCQTSVRRKMNAAPYNTRRKTVCCVCLDRDDMFMLFGDRPRMI